MSTFLDNPRVSRRSLGKLYHEAPYPDLKPIAKNAGWAIKQVLHDPNSAFYRERVPHLAQTLASLAGSLDPCFKIPGLSEQEAIARSMFLYKVSHHLNNVDCFLIDQRGYIDTHYAEAPAYIGEEEAVWLALFQAVDLAEVRADLQRKADEHKGAYKRLYEYAVVMFLDRANTSMYKGTPPTYDPFQLVYALMDTRAYHHKGKGKYYIGHRAKRELLVTVRRHLPKPFTVK